MGGSIDGWTDLICDTWLNLWCQLNSKYNILRQLVNCIETKVTDPMTWGILSIPLDRMKNITWKFAPSKYFEFLLKYGSKIHIKYMPFLYLIKCVHTIAFSSNKVGESFIHELN